MRASFVVIAAAALGASTGAMAQISDHNGYGHIVAGNYVAAEREIAQGRDLFPNDPDLLLNLAMVYAHTGRMAEARALYRNVLAQPDEAMALTQGAVSSRTMAARELRRMDGVKQASR